MEGKIKQPKRILAIDPGTRYIGIVIMEEEKPIYYVVKTIKTNQSDLKRIQEARNIIQNLIDLYHPEILVIEKPYDRWTKQSELLSKITSVLKKTGRENKMQVKEFTPEQVREAICGNFKATKCEIAHKLILKHPDMMIFLNQNRIKDRYWHHMFDALGLGVAETKPKNIDYNS